MRRSFQRWSEQSNEAAERLTGSDRPQGKRRIMGRAKEPARIPNGKNETAPASVLFSKHKATQNGDSSPEVPTIPLAVVDAPPVMEKTESVDPKRPKGEAPQAMAKEISQAVLKQLSDEAFLDEILKSKSLVDDNRQLSAQIKQLLKEKRAMADYCDELEKQVASFKPLFGHIYLKIQ